MSSSDSKSKDNDLHHKKRRKEDDKDSWHVKSLDEILEEKRLRKEREERKQVEAMSFCKIDTRRILSISYVARQVGAIVTGPVVAIIVNRDPPHGRGIEKPWVESNLNVPKSK